MLTMGTPLAINERRPNGRVATAWQGLASPREMNSKLQSSLTLSTMEARSLTQSANPPKCGSLAAGGRSGRKERLSEISSGQ